MVAVAAFLVLAVLGFGLLFFRLHSLPERIAHRGHKLQFEIVAVLCLISLFTHMHIFWIAGLLLALVDLPDFGTPLNRIAGSAEKIAGLNSGEGAASPVSPSGPDNAGQVGKREDRAQVMNAGTKLLDGTASAGTSREAIRQTELPHA